MKNKQTVLILGATGMLGHSLYKTLIKDPTLRVFGTTRETNAKNLFPKEIRGGLIPGIDVENLNGVANLFKKIRPNVVINAVGIIKQLDVANDPLKVLPINAVFPHQLAKLCKQNQARLVLLSTDCVFSGKKGNYRESDSSDCEDLYGRSKYLGEISNQDHVLTIRTSGIGHELRGGKGLLSWFLKQKSSATGYSKAIYSGLPSIELANIIRTHIIPNPNLSGLYQVSANPISKYDLLHLIAKIYNKKIVLKKSQHLKIDRSLNSTRFRKITGYKTKPWEKLIIEMRQDYESSKT